MKNTIIIRLSMAAVLSGAAPAYAIEWKNPLKIFRKTPEAEKTPGPRDGVRPTRESSNPEDYGKSQGPEASFANDVIQTYKADESILKVVGAEKITPEYLAKQDPYIGRDDKIEIVKTRMRMRKKQNALIRGEAGGGKTTMFYEISRRLYSDFYEQVELFKRGELDASQILFPVITNLDVNGLVGNSMLRGSMEGKAKALLDYKKSLANIEIDLVDQAGNVVRDQNGLPIKIKQMPVLFMDEAHQIMGAGRSMDGADGLANIFKPFMSGTDGIRFLLATTLDESEVFARDTAWLRRLGEPIDLDSPTVAEAINILKGLRERMNNFYGVRFTDEAIEAAAHLANKFSKKFVLPDPAITLMDEVGAKFVNESLKGAPNQIKFLDLQERIASLKKEQLESVWATKNAMDLTAIQKNRERFYEIKKLETELERLASRKADPKAPAVTAQQIIQKVSENTGLSTEAVGNLYNPTRQSLARPASDLARSQSRSPDVGQKMVPRLVQRFLGMGGAKQRPKAMVVVLGDRHVDQLVKAVDENFYSANNAAHVRNNKIKTLQAIDLDGQGLTPAVLGSLVADIKDRPRAIAFQNVNLSDEFTIKKLAELQKTGKITFSYGDAVHMKEINFTDCVVIVHFKNSPAGLSDAVRANGDPENAALAVYNHLVPPKRVGENGSVPHNLADASHDPRLDILRYADAIVELAESSRLTLSKIARSQTLKYGQQFGFQFKVQNRAAIDIAVRAKNIDSLEVEIDRTLGTALMELSSLNRLKPEDVVELAVKVTPTEASTESVQLAARNQYSLVVTSTDGARSSYPILPSGNLGDPIVMDR